MRLLFFLILLILIGGGGFILFYRYEEAMIALQKDNHLIKNQLSLLRNKYNTLLDNQKKYSIEFLTVDNQYGLIPKDTNVYLYPDENSPVLKNINIGMQAGILEKAVIDSATWYYVALPTDSNINSRGWIPEESFTNISASQQELYTQD